MLINRIRLSSFNCWALVTPERSTFYLLLFLRRGERWPSATPQHRLVFYHLLAVSLSFLHLFIVQSISGAQFYSKLIIYHSSFSCHPFNPPCKPPLSLLFSSFIIYPSNITLLICPPAHFITFHLWDAAVFVVYPSFLHAAVLSSIHHMNCLVLFWFRKPFLFRSLCSRWKTEQTIVVLFWQRRQDAL